MLLCVCPILGLPGSHSSHIHDCKVLKVLKVLGLYFHPLVVLGPAALSRLLTPKKGTRLFSSYT